MSRVFNFQMATSVAGTDPSEILWSHKASTLYGSLQTSRQIPVAPKAGPARENLQLFLPIHESKEESLNDTVQTLLGLVRTEPQEETRFSVIGRQKLSAALKLLHSVSGSVAKAEAKKAQQASKTTTEPIDPLVRLAIRTTLALFFAVVQDYIQENEFELCLEFAQTCQESLKNFPPFFLVDQAAESGDQTLDSIFDFLLAVIAEPVNPAAPAESAAQVKRAFFQILLSVLLLRARLRDVLKLNSALSAPGISLQLSYADLTTLREAVQALQGRIGDFEGLKEESEIEKKVNAKIKHDSERDENIPLVNVTAYISRFIARISTFLLSQLETSKNIAATTAENEIFALGSNANQQLGSAGPSGETTTVYTTVFDKSIKVAHAGSGCTHFLTDDGHVFALGKGDYGRLGIDNTNDTNTPTELTGDIKNSVIVKVANSKGNYGHGLAIDSQGGLWSWGDGDFGKLGHGDTSQRPAPVKISFFNNKVVTEIACGYKHSICLTDDGTVYTWGGNDSGAIGDGTTSGSNSPQKITLEGPAKNVFAGAYTSFALLETGQLVGWGLNDEGELGVGNKTNVLTPHTYTDFVDPIIFVAGGENHTLFLDAKQNVFISGSISTADATKPTTPLELEGKKVSYIASGPHYAYAIVDGDVYGWGNANDSQLGTIGNQSSPTINEDLSGRNIQYISAGLSHVFFCTKGESILKANLVKSFLPLVVEANAETFVALNKLVAGLKEKAETATEYDEDVLDIVNYHLFIANVVGLDKQADFLQQLRTNLSDLLYVPKFSTKTQKIFQTNWNIMLPSVEERTKVALESIPKSEQECKDFQGTQRFLFEIIVSSLPKSPHFASALGLLNGSDIEVESLPDKFARTLDFLRSVILCSKFHNFSFIAGLANGSLDDAAIASAPSTASSYEGLLTYLTKFILAKQFVNSEKPDLVLYNNDLVSQTVAILLHHSIELVEFVLQITNDNPALEEATLKKISETLERTVLRNALCLMVYSLFNLKIETTAKYEQELIQLLGLLDRLSRKLYGESHLDFEKQELSWPASAVENDHYKTPFWLIEIEQGLSLSLGNLAVQQIESTPLSDQEKDETLAILIKQRLFSNGIDLDKQPGRYYEFTDDLVSGSNEGAILIDLVEDFASQKMLSVSLPMENESFRKVMRLALACLLKHHGLVSVAYMYAQNVEAHAPPKKLVPIFSKLYLLVLEPLSHKVQPPDEVKGKEEEKDFPSIEAICEPIIKRLDFLLYNLRAATLTEELIAEPAPAPATGRLSLTSTMPDILSTGRSRLTSSAINYGSSGSSSSSSSSSAFSDDSQPRALGLGQSLRRASSFSRESKRNKKSAWKPLTSIISTLRRFQWMQSSGIQTAQEKNTLIGQIAEFIFKDQLSLGSLEQALTAQQVRAEQRIKGLKFLFSLISREHIFDSVRLHSIRSCFRFIFPASTMVSFRSNIEASPCDTQQSIETLTINIHKNLCATVVSAINTLSKIVEIENLEEADAELKASVNCQSWLVLYAIKSLTVKLSARETDNIVESGILDALSLILNPNKTSAARTFFEPLTKHSRRLLRVILSAMGTLTSDLKESTLKRLDNFLLKTVRASSEASTPEGLHALLSYIHDSSVSSKFKQLLSSPSWTDLYFKLINESTLQVRLLTLRLLNSLLSSWKTTQQGVKRYAGILQQLFRSLAYHLTFPTVKVPSIECSGQAFAWDSTTALKCTVEDTTIIQTESCSISEPGYVLGAFPMTSGRYEMEFESAIDSATDETICIGLSRQNPRSPGFENSPDMWIYRAYNGEIYHSGRVGTIEKWTVGDKMLMEVDLDQNTLTFSKNGEVQDCSGFRDSHAIEAGLYPIILFYGSSTRINIKVNSFISPTVVSDSQPKVPKHVDPRFSPPVLNLAEELVSTLRTLLKSSDWARLINSFVSTQLRNIPRTLTYISTSEESKVPIKLSDSVNEDTYVGSLMSVLGLFSNFSDSFRIGSLCVSPSKGEAFVQNYTSSTSGILATHLESENIMNDAIFKLTHVPSSPFDFEKLSSPDNEVQNLFSLVVPIEEAQSLERQKLSLLALKTLATMVQLAPQVHKLLIAHPEIVTRSIKKAATTQPLRNGFEIDVLEKLSIVLQLEIKYRIENPTPEPDPEAEKKEEVVAEPKEKKDEPPVADVPAVITSPVLSRARRSSIGPADAPSSPLLSRASLGSGRSSEDEDLAAAIQASLLASSPPRGRRSSIGPADAPSTPPLGRRSSIGPADAPVVAVSTSPVFSRARRSSIGPADAPSTPPLGRRSSIGPAEEDDELAAAIEASLRAAAAASPAASPVASPRRRRSAPASEEEEEEEELGFGLFGSDSESHAEDLFGSSSPKPKKKADSASNKKGKAPKKELTFDEYSKKVLIEESDGSQSAPSFEEAVNGWKEDAETITAFKSALKFKSLGADDDSSEPVVAGPNPAKVSRKPYNLARKIIASAKSIEQLQAFLFKVHQSLEIMYSRQLITTLIQMDPKVEDKRILDTEALEEDLKTKIALIILLTAAKRSGSKAYSAFGKIIKTVLQNSPSVSKMLVSSCLTNLVNASRKASKDGHYSSDLEAATTPSFAESKYLLEALVQDLSSIKKKSWIQNMSSALSACTLSTHLKPEDREFSAVQIAKLLKNVKARSPELLAKLKEQDMIKKLLEQAPIILKKQHKHESGINKGFTAFVKNLAMALMSLEAKETLESTEGLEWLEQFSTSFLMLEAMANRNPFPDIFLKSLEKDINDDSRPALDNKLFTKELDQLLQDWRNKKPTDLVSMCDVFGFGESERSQLSGTESLSSPTVRPDFSVRAPRNVYLGERCTFIEPEDGKILAIGCGSYGRLGVGNNDDASDFKNVQCDVLFRVVMCSKGGYGHSVAIDFDKKLWSWGDGDYGKLGQGDTDHRNKPTLIPSLADKDFVAASCGFRHSAAVDSDGNVWTWGQCDNGKLGSDTSDNRTTPETVTFPDSTKIKLVSCSSNQTFAVSEDGEKVFAFGASGSALGTIEFSDVTSPVEVSFEHAPIVKIESGDGITFCIDSEGKLYGWGSDSNAGLNDVYATNISEGLNLSVVFKDIAVGNNFALALTEDFQVWSVGPSPQVGRSDDTEQWKPIEQFSDGKKKAIAAGSNHAIVFYAPVEGVEPPPKVPPEYAALEQVPAGALRLRVQILSKFSKYLSASLALVDFENEKKILQIVKSIVQTSTKIELLNKILDSSSVSDTGGSIRLNRYLATVSKNKTIFAQAAEQLLTRSPADLRQSGRVWSCEFIGEAAADAGGPYNESISQMVEELNSGSTPCLQISPNGRAAIGVNQDRLVAKPGASVRALRLFKFLGILFGIAIRTHHPMALFVARPFWKQLVGDELTPQDLKDVDEPYFKLLDCLKDMQDSGVDEDTFLDFLDRVPDSFPPLLLEDGTKMNLKLENIAAYRELAIAKKLHETDNEFKSIREGLDMVVPLTALSLFTSAEIEKLICGDEIIDWELLKKNTDYSDYSASDQPIVWLWDVLQNEFSVAEGVLFLRFCWGRTRLPKNANDWGRRFQINSMDEGVADNYLPKAVTCFFKFLLPRYTSREILLKRLRTAIAYTTTIETDEYSRRELDVDELNRAAIEEDDE